MLCCGPQLSLIWPPNLVSVLSEPQLSPFWPLTPVLASNVQWASTLLVLASHPRFSLQSAVVLNCSHFSLRLSFRPPVCNGLQVSSLRLSTCPLVFHPQFGLHSAMGLPPSFQSPVFILAFPLQQSSTLVLVSHSVVRFPCPGQPLLCGQTAMLDLASTLSQASHARSSLLLCHGPSTLGSASHLVLGLNSRFSLPCSVWFPLCVQPRALCLASSLLWPPALGLASFSLVILPSPFGLCSPVGLPLRAHVAVSAAGEGTLCRGRLFRSAAPLGAGAEPLLRVWWGRAVPAAPRASGTS